MSAPFRILVVDDQTALAETLRDYLVGEGYAADVALTGDDAVKIIAERGADLVLLDIMMPGIDGVETLRRIKAIDAAIPVVMATANEDVGVATQALKIGAFDYLMKPFDLGRLCNVIGVALAQGRRSN